MAGADVVALARTPSKAAELANRGVHVREADYARPETLRAALVGVDRNLQRAYVSSVYDNQSDTTYRALTWVGEATAAGGLYVGTTCGRCASTVHVVADLHSDEDVADSDAGKRPRAAWHRGGR